MLQSLNILVLAGNTDVVVVGRKCCKMREEERKKEFLNESP
jgi:hypothetical protein